MKALADKVETVDPSLIVEYLEFDDVFAEGKIGLFKAGGGNRALVNRPDTKNKLAEVFVILLGEDTIEDARAKDIDVKK